SSRRSSATRARGMTVAEAINFEGLLREALAPVEPPEDLIQRLEVTLETITELAADELEAWELRAMRDPRNWARPAAALVAGGAARASGGSARARRRPRRVQLGSRAHAHVLSPPIA